MTRYKNGYRVHLLDRIADRFLVGDGCWSWLGPFNSSGYGSVKPYREPVKGAHVVLYELFVGPVSGGMELDHLCRNKKCVRPDHLEPVTRAENNQRNPNSRFNQLAARTHCAKGHPFSEENTILRSDNNGRRCRTCAYEQNNASYRRRHSA